MQKSRWIPASLIVLFGLVVASAFSAPPPAKKAAGPTDAQLIADAMSAAPATVAKNATIVIMAADGKMRTLRKGTNGYTCMPDNPHTPAPDPICAPHNAIDWIA